MNDYASKAMMDSANALFPGAIKTLQVAAARLEFFRGLDQIAVDDAMRKWAAENPDDKPNWREIKNIAWTIARAKKSAAQGQSRSSATEATFHRWAQDGVLWAGELCGAGIGEHGLCDWQDADSGMASYQRQYRSNDWGTDASENARRAQMAYRLHAAIAKLSPQGEHTRSLSRSWLARLEIDLGHGGYPVPPRSATAIDHSYQPKPVTPEDGRMF